MNTFFNSIQNCSIFAALILLIASVAQSALPVPNTVRSLYVRAGAKDVDKINTTRLTHIVYAFARVSNDGICIVDDDETLEGLKILRAQNSILKLILSVGGWDGSNTISDAINTIESRNKFSMSCADICHSLGFDGLDIDYEFPVSGGKKNNMARKEDKKNYTLFLQSLRQSLDSLKGSRKALSVSYGNTNTLLKNLEVTAVATIIDWFNIMTYDGVGAWSPLTLHHVPLTPNEVSPDPQHSIVSIVDRLTEQGMQRHQIVLALPLYGRGWQHVSSSNSSQANAHGLFVRHRGDYTNGDWTKGVFPYHFIVKEFTENNGWKSWWDDSAKSEILFHPILKAVVSFESVRSMKEKARWAAEKSIRGISLWEFTHDDSQSSLQKGAFDTVLSQ